MIKWGSSFILFPFYFFSSSNYTQCLIYERDKRVLTRCNSLRLIKGSASLNFLKIMETKEKTTSITEVTHDEVMRYIKEKEEMKKFEEKMRKRYETGLPREFKFSGIQHYMVDLEMMKRDISSDLDRVMNSTKKRANWLLDPLLSGDSGRLTKSVNHIKGLLSQVKGDSKKFQRYVRKINSSIQQAEELDCRIDEVSLKKLGYKARNNYFSESISRIVRDPELCCYMLSAIIQTIVDDKKRFLKLKREGKI